MLGIMQAKIMNELNDNIRELKQNQINSCNTNCEEFDFDKNVEITDEQFAFDYEEDFDS